MASVTELQAQLAAAQAEEIKNSDRPRRSLSEILHEFASVTGRHYLHEDIDALDKSDADDDDSSDATAARKAPVTTGKEGTNA
jgi:hypothetical protein